MDTEQYQKLEEHMLSCMEDSAHDREHIYRVLYVAMDIASFEEGVDYDVLIASCLLHDIGRNEQFENPSLCHAMVGGEKAYNFLLSNNYGKEYAVKVKSCIETHRFRDDNPLQGIEAKILFDADKIDATGTLGIARTLLYNGQVSEPLYSMLPNGNVSDGSDDQGPSFFKEYKYKLEKLYSKFYTKRALQIAAQRQESAKSFYESMLSEASSSYEMGMPLLKQHLLNAVK